MCQATKHKNGNPRREEEETASKGGKQSTDTRGRLKAMVKQGLGLGRNPGQNPLHNKVESPSQVGRPKQVRGPQSPRESDAPKKIKKPPEASSTLHDISSPT